MRKVFGVIAAIALLLVIALPVLAAPSANSGQCPGATTIGNTPTSDGTIVLAAGLTVCIHASNGNTGQFVTDGTTTLAGYILASGLLNEGGQVPGVSNYVIYPTPEVTPSPSPTPISTPTPTPSVDPTPTPTPSASPSSTPTPTASPTPVVTPSTTPLPTPPATDTVDPSGTGTVPAFPTVLAILFGAIAGSIGATAYLSRTKAR